MYWRRPLVPYSLHLSPDDHPNKLQKWKTFHFMPINSPDCSTCLFRTLVQASNYGRWCRLWLQSVPSDVVIVDVACEGLLDVDTHPRRSIHLVSWYTAVALCSRMIWLALNAVYLKCGACGAVFRHTDKQMSTPRNMKFVSRKVIISQQSYLNFNHFQTVLNDRNVQWHYSVSPAILVLCKKKHFPEHGNDQSINQSIKAIKLRQKCGISGSC